MTKFRLEFDLSIFIEGCRPTMAKYFRGEITAEVAAKHLGIGRNKWEMHMAEIFSEALRGGAFSKITEITEADPTVPVDVDQFTCSKCGEVTKSTDYDYKMRKLYLDLKEDGRCEKCARGGE